MLAICHAIGSAAATVATGMSPPVPQRQRNRRHASEHDGIQRGEHQAVQRDQAHLPLEGSGEAQHAIAHEGVFLLGLGEQLEGEDVGVAVHDATGEQAALFAGGLGARLHARDDVAQQARISDEPQ
jgi:hypothetical protein